MSHPKLEDLLGSSSPPEQFVREALAGLESAHRRIALLALADWIRLGTPARPLFAAIATLQRPSWGSWNGLILGLREARRDALRDASAEERKHIDTAHLLRRLLRTLEQPLDAAMREALAPLASSLGARLPKTLRWRELLALPIALRNRVAHDAPTDSAWWESTAAHLRPLLALHVHESPIDMALGDAELRAPWKIAAEGAAWTFSGLTAKFEARYIDAGGNQRLDEERGAELVGIFQRLLGREQVQAKHFRRLLGRLAPEEIKGVLMGDLLVGRPVGRGGFATVHMGRQLSTGRKVAVKILHDGMEDEAKERFRREAAYLSRFRDAHIVQVLGYGEERWSAPKQISLMGEDWFKAFKKTAPIKTYMALEWIEGETLEDVFQRSVGTEPSLPQLSGWMAEAAGALESVHRAHLIHRDIKPGNLMVSEDRGIVLMDFGIARSRDEGRTLLTATGAAVGTPAYMSPEQLRAVDADAEVGPPSDVYALCATFYELFARERLYHHDTEAPETVRTRKIEGHRPELPRLPAQQLPWEIRTILLGGLESDPSDRYRSAAALQGDLLRCLRDEPIAYRRPSLLRRTQLAYRRNRAVVNLIGAFAIVAASLAAYLQWSAAEERRADLRRREQAVVEAAAVGRAELALRRREVGALADTDATPLRSPTGEPIEPAVDAWFGAHMRAVDALEELLALAARAPTEAARRSVDPEAVLAEHARLSLSAARKATELDRFSLANMWIARAAGRGAIDAEERAAAVVRVAEVRQRRIEQDLDKARAILADARTQSDIAPEHVEQQVIAVVRLASPDLVRLLLRPRYLDSPHELERRIVIGALGRLGDARTKGPQELDAVEALCLRLRDVDVRVALPTALALARALGDLRDARAHAPFENKRNEAGIGSPFSQRSNTAFTRIPLPARPTGSDGTNVDALLERATALADKGRWKEVVEVYDRLLAADPESAHAYRERARARGMIDDPQGALEDYSEALKRWPGWADALAGRALVLVEFHRLDEALRDAEQAIAARPSAWLGYFALGMIKTTEGQWERAEKAFTRVIEINRQLAEVYMQRGLVRLKLGRRQDAEADFKQLKELTPDAPAVLLLSASAYLEAGHYELALADADRAIALDPTLPELFGMRALCWARLRRAPAKVEADIQAALRLAPDHIGVRLFVSRAWAAIERWDEALASVEQVLRTDETNAQALLIRGQIHEARREYDRALADYTLCIGSDPNEVKAYLRRAGVLARRRSFEGAFADLERAGRLAPRSLDVKMARGEIYVRQGRWPEALREFSSVVRIDPGHHLALRQRGVARRGMGDYAGSVKDLTQCLARKPNDVLALFDRAGTYLRMGEYGLAEQDLNRVIELDPKEGAAFNNRSVARQNLGRIQEAWEDAKQAVRLMPDFAGHHAQVADLAKRLGKRREALDAYAAALRVDPRYAIAHIHRGNLYLDARDLAAAHRDFAAALEIDPLNPEALNGRGTVRLKRERVAEAIDDFNLALDAKPAAALRAVLLSNRGAARHQMGDAEAAMEDYNAALRAEAGFSGAYYLRGMLHAELGDDAKAAQDLRTFLELSPDAPQAARARRYLAALEEDR